MPVPSSDTFMLPLLRLLADGQEHDVRELRDRLAVEFKLSDSERGERIGERRQPAFDNRVGWAKTYLDKAGLLETPRRAWCRITDAGRKVLAEKPERIDREFLLRFDHFRAFADRSEPGEPVAVTEPVAEGSLSTPEEALERLLGRSARRSRPTFSTPWARRRRASLRRSSSSRS